MKKLENMTYQELSEVSKRAKWLLERSEELFFWNLTPMQSRIYHLREVEKNTWKDICKITGLSFNNAKKYYQQAVEKIDERERLKEIVPKNLRYIPSNFIDLHKAYKREIEQPDIQESLNLHGSKIYLVVNNEVERGDFTSVVPHFEELEASDIFDYDSEVWADGKTYSFQNLRALKKFIDTHPIFFKDEHLNKFTEKGWDQLETSLDIYSGDFKWPNTIVYTISCTEWRNYK